jgi:hypothetical protein
MLQNRRKSLVAFEKLGEIAKRIVHLFHFGVDP